jgi:hypothetical protein
VLEPDAHPAAGPFKRALVADGIPFTSLAVDDCAAAYERLVARGVVFTQPPVATGPVTTAVFDDTWRQPARGRPDPYRVRRKCAIRFAAFARTSKK